MRYCNCDRPFDSLTCSLSPIHVETPSTTSSETLNFLNFFWLSGSRKSQRTVVHCTTPPSVTLNTVSSLLLFDTLITSTPEFFLPVIRSEGKLGSA